MADLVLEGERLILRLPQASDLAWQLEHLNTEAVMRNLGGVRSTQDLAASFAANAAALVRGEPGFWTIARKADGEVLGKCGLSRIDTPAAPDDLRGGLQIGWSLAEPFWGQGLASEAARIVTGRFFADAGQEMLWSQTSDSNAASTRMMARLGFRRCRALDYVDPDYPAEDNPTTVYRIGRKEWAGTS